MFSLGGLKVTFPGTVTELDLKFTCVSPVMVPAGCSDFRSRAGELPDVTVFFAKHTGSMQPQRASVAATCHCLWQGNGEECEGIQAGRRHLLPRLLLSTAAFRSLLSLGAWLLPSTLARALCRVGCPFSVKCVGVKAIELVLGLTRWNCFRTMWWFYLL